MDLGLTDKVAIITGGSAGIGKVTALNLLQEGAKVAICGRRTELLENTKTEFYKKSGKLILTVQADVSKESDVKYFINKVIDEFGTVDILINNAGKRNAYSFENVTNEKWNEDFNLKFYGAVWMCKYTLPIMKKNRNGRIINITTIQGKQPSKSSMPTSITRAAGIAFTKALSNDYAQYNILVNTVCLGFVKSDQWITSKKLDFPDLTQKQYYDHIGKGTPLGRIGETEEAADLITYLASERSSYITGTAINLDGGLSAVV